ncbi:prepilin-type N-terminal cleavage/methylation domain-containing protein [Wenzhouxiangella sp. AB-CW3]|uniref:prepilin-type N-terminal cleavage/methylation domain-containing protein n=1 Tax=Wenzhouxiangella sp. AB-CW3 TaxID=2771012 RepID=UPI00168B28E9|nr:prepilin-type N-terminal cleavage/methylation domain-containing protein [Wenzhouxiangella sp. AB-CW3]QOC23833.1 prepilin-type N-terminal cleavage/methylation domain-containing protein [Wenzhouxiangella sp. AB-CW3]
MPHWAERSRCTKRRQQGFTLLELIIVIILVVALFLVAMQRLFPLRGDAEAAHVTSVTGTLRSALGMEAAARVVREGLPAIIELEAGNPMQLLAERPDNYLGELSTPDDVPPGYWYFDNSANVLGYRVRFPQYLEGAPDDPVHLHWQVQVEYGSESRDDRTPTPRGLHLVALHQYHWPDQPRPEERLGTIH